MTIQLDAIDVKILQELQRDGRLSIVDLAGRVGLSPSPCLRRVRNLEESGIIRGYRAEIAAEKVGLGLTVFMQCRAKDYSEETMGAIDAGLAAIEEVVAWNLLSGDLDCQLQIVVRDLKHYETLLLDSLLALPLCDPRSQFVIAERKSLSPLPLDHLPSESAPAQRRTAEER